MRFFDILPAHPHPLNDELFSSWFSRLAFDNMSKVHSFAVEIFGRSYGYSFWSRDVDCFIDQEHLLKISKRTGINVTEIFETTIKSYEGVLFTNLNRGFNRWILPCGIYHRTRKTNWIAYCPLCIAADQTPYFRKSWRLSFSLVCPIHHIHMLDSCPKCNYPINVFRQELGTRSKYIVNSIVECAYCKFDLRNSNIRLIELIDFKIIQNLFDLIKKHTWGWWYLKQSRNILPYSFAYYDVIHYLCSFLNSKVGMPLYREALIGLNLDESLCLQNRKNQVFEVRRIEERFNLLVSTIWLLENWPIRIVDICKHNEITASRITRSENLPF
ncbi:MULTISPECIES: TniQ family protein [Acinetobacter]|uniref:TniQ family protein n=1 Tax=Acinetobacter piscicola TaxID=2006115 RepID=A0A7S7AH75_9GAMM|nr:MULTISPECIES: TniQ family protein [Acinetobacter]QOW45666.1 TniQ family protein [Acinetobacter piscicola]